MPIDRIRVEGGRELASKMDRVGNGFQGMMEQATEEAVIRVHSLMPDYPPEPPASTYVRTLTLWKTITSLKGHAPEALSRVERGLFGKVVGVIGTTLSYAAFVIDRERQARMHQGRWWTLQAVVEGARDDIREVYEKHLRDLIRRTFK